MGHNYKSIHKRTLHLLKESDECINLKVNGNNITSYGELVNFIKTLDYGNMNNFLMDITINLSAGKLNNNYKLVK